MSVPETLYQLYRKTKELLRTSERSAILVLFFLVFILFVPYLSEQHWRMVMDESIFVYQGYRIADGGVFYQDTMIDKPPGMPYTFGLFFFLFGKNVLVSRFFTGLVAAGTSVLVYKAGSNIHSRTAGYFAGMLYGLAAAHPGVGSIGWSIAETYMNFYVAFAFLFFIRYIQMEEKKEFNALMAGIFLGIAFLMKQPGGITGLPFTIIIFLQGGITTRLANKLKFFLLMVGGSVFAILPWFIYFWFQGLEGELIKWSFTVWSDLEPIATVNDKIIITAKVILRLAILTILALGGLVIMAKNLIRENGNDLVKAVKLPFNKPDSHLLDFCLALWMVIFTIFLFISPDMYSHYLLQMALPAVFLGGQGAREAYLFLAGKVSNESSLGSTGSLVVALIILSSGVSLGDYAQDVVIGGGKPPYQHQVEIADYIKAHTTDSDLIYTFRWPQIYIYSNREAASKYFILMVGFTPLNSIGREIRDDLEANKPLYITTIDAIQGSQKYSQTYDFIVKNYYVETTVGGKNIYRLTADNSPR